MKQQAVLGFLVLCVLVHVVLSDDTFLRRTRKKTAECRYTKGDWSECNTATNLITRTRTLKKGPQSCDQTVVDTKRCQKACRYRKVKWGGCDETTMLKSRTRTLKKGGSSCNQTLVETRPCKKQKCRYARGGTWSACAGNTKTKVRTLVPGSPANCDATMTMTKKCKTRSDSRCSFGSWSKFGSCENGKKKKTRTVLTGGNKCKKRTERIKDC